MRIAVIGAGQVGRALGDGWTTAGHDVVYGVRDPADRKYVADTSRRYLTIAAAAGLADILVLTTPFGAAEAAIRAAGDIAGKTLIDCTNPLGMGPQGLHLTVGHSDSGSERIAGHAKDAFVFKAFNSIGVENMTRAKAFAVPPAMFIAGDDAERKGAVMQLARDLGFDPIDAGPLANARLLEPLAMLWIDQAQKRNAGRDFAFAIVRREG